jgi:hypothetical protein
MYLEMGYKIVLWNYRGYGQSTGDPTISNCISDAQAVYNYCKIFLKLLPEIAHGYSIGGPPAACLAYKNAFKILVVDRSFCNFVNVNYFKLLDCSVNISTFSKARQNRNER